MGKRISKTFWPAYARTSSAARWPPAHGREIRKYSQQTPELSLRGAAPQGALARWPAEQQARRRQVTLPFAALTVRLVRDYEHYLISLGNCDITIHRKLSFIKTVLLWAVEEGVLATEKNPFDRIKLHEGRPGERPSSAPPKWPASKPCQPSV